PSARRVAVWLSRAVLREPVLVHVPVAGLKRSAVTVAGPPVLPPATRTEPSRSRVAVWKSRGLLSDPVAVHWPTGPAADTGHALMPSSVAAARGRARARRWRRGVTVGRKGTAGPDLGGGEPWGAGVMGGSPDHPRAPAPARPRHGPTGPGPLVLSLRRRSPRSSPGGHHRARACRATSALTR